MPDQVRHDAFTYLVAGLIINNAGSFDCPGRISVLVIKIFKERGIHPWLEVRGGDITHHIGGIKQGPMRSKNGKIAYAIIATIIWSISYGMIVLDKEPFQSCSLIFFNIGLVFSFGVTDSMNRKITLKEYLPRLLLIFLIIGALVFAFIKVPLLQKRPPQPYRSISAAVFFVVFIVCYWRHWSKEIKKIK